MNIGNSTEVLVDTARDMLVINLASAKRRVHEAIDDITENEVHWEPISKLERTGDLGLAPDSKKVWRVFQVEGVWVYDYTPVTLAVPPFTTIAWIMNHIAQTGDMYLYCLKSGKLEGLE